MSKDISKVPREFRWMISYRPEDILQNIKWIETGLEHFKMNIPIRVFVSPKTAAVVITVASLNYVRNPHVMEWYDTFYEIHVEEAKKKFKLK